MLGDIQLQPDGTELIEFCFRIFYPDVIRAFGEIIRDIHCCGYRMRVWWHTYIVINRIVFLAIHGNQADPRRWFEMVPGDGEVDGRADGRHAGGNVSDSRQGSLGIDNGDHFRPWCRNSVCIHNTYPIDISGHSQGYLHFQFSLRYKGGEKEKVCAVVFKTDIIAICGIDKVISTERNRFD